MQRAFDTVTLAVGDWAVKSPLTGTARVDRIGAIWVTGAATASGTNGRARPPDPPSCPGERR
jgi:hypothetical protein